MVKVFFKTFGCSANASDTEIMKAVLAKEGHTLETTAEAAEVIVLNICTVKGDGPALREVRKTQELFPTKKVVLAGCVTRSIVDAIRKVAPEAAFINTHHVDKIGLAVQSVFDTPIEVLSGSHVEKPRMPKVRTNQTVGIIQCVSGCDSACAFCSTKLVKGATQSYSLQSICAEIKQCVEQGCRIIWLTGTDMSCYGLDIGTDLPTLVEAVASVSGDFMVRVGMANPKHVVKYSERLAKAMLNDKVFKFLHVPIQSGNDRILQLMKRQHTIAEFNNMVSVFRSIIPDITIATDLITGFPEETEAELEDSLRFIENAKPVVVNISRFKSRPGTIASRMPNQVQGNISNERSR
ncbi:MAG: tRNA (N(6)-L-threonylcarbamoyladenosine(37)-C(2))-methylthiotransferase, partial [Candidatus Woesearchaeota archaeon]|nr:tRNA (N(6)-L-threonylcarbamoyladenosine(37)-C(2))-methylthiotransferase [Candidatus Woesearchaeota archaeon]